jgi:hypothetical protein
LLGITVDLEMKLLKTYREVIRKLVKALVAAGKSVPDPVASQKYREIASEAAQWLIDTQPKRRPEWDWRKKHPNVILTHEPP